MYGEKRHNIVVSKYPLQKEENCARSTVRVQVGSGQVSSQPATELKIRPIYDSDAALIWATVCFFWQNLLILQLKENLIAEEAEEGKEKVTRKENRKKVIKERIKGIEDTTIRGERKIA